jgi:hypothetical protein
VTLGVLMNKSLWPQTDAATILKHGFGLTVSRGGICRAVQRVARQAMRLPVVIRKNWGGNRTEDGARAQAALSSVLSTERQQDKDVFEPLTDPLRSPEPKLLDIVGKVTAVSESCPPADGPTAKTREPRRNAVVQARVSDFAESLFCRTGDFQGRRHPSSVVREAGEEAWYQ